jgi:hypothetical protein
MTSRIIPADKPEEKKWPRLMTYSDNSEYLFLVTSLKEDGNMIGVRIDSNHRGNIDAGEYVADGLIDFHGTVELSND